MAYVLTTAILLVWVVLIAMMVRAVLKTPSCPECGSDRMESVDMRTSIIVIDGAKVPAAWMYRRCHDCSARLKWDIGQDGWVELEPGEWDEVVRSVEDVEEI
jgi:hypothetical protein